MATFLDVTALQNFSVIFVFVFVAVAVYAMLLFTKVFGQNQWINAVLGLMIAFFVIMSETATLVVKQVAPVFAVILVLIAIVSVASGMLGASSDSMPAMKYIVLVILVVALIVGSLAIVRQNVDVPERGEDFSKTSTVIFHPNYLGMIVLFLIAVFTVGLLAAKQT